MTSASPPAPSFAPPAIPTISEGNVVFSKKGRDKGHVFVVLLTLDADFVLIVDGDRRKLANPKKKRRKHLSATPYQLPALLSLHSLGRLKDSDIRKSLQPFQAGEAAPAPKRPNASPSESESSAANSDRA